VYAVIQTGGKQYKVSEGMSLRVEKVAGEKGEQVVFDQVLLVGGDGNPRIGVPVVEGVSVAAKIVRQDRDKKVIVYKKKRRKGYEKKIGHRQYFTEISITKINA
jgi:large subunit ribosomal protein L21